MIAMRCTVALATASLVFPCFLSSLSSQPADTPWPMFRHDTMRTGLSPYTGPSAPALSWTYRFGGNITSSPAIGIDDKVCIGSQDNRMYVLNSNGTLAWSYRTKFFVESSPAVGNDGGVYFGSFDNRFYVLGSSGMLDWSYLTGDYIYSSPLLGDAGRVSVGSCDNRL